MITEKKRKVLILFEEGRSLYTEMNFAAALKQFRSALVLDPGDGPSLVYERRCRHYMVNPPSKNWDGVFTMKTK